MIIDSFFTLALLPRLQDEICDVLGFAADLNYGFTKVRFPVHCPVGPRLQLRLALGSIEEVAGDGLHLLLVDAFEAESVAQPACRAEMLGRMCCSAPAGATPSAAGGTSA